MMVADIDVTFHSAAYLASLQVVAALSFQSFALFNFRTLYARNVILVEGVGAHVGHVVGNGQIYLVGIDHSYGGLLHHSLAAGGGQSHKGALSQRGVAEINALKQVALLGRQVGTRHLHRHLLVFVANDDGTGAGRDGVAHIDELQRAVSLHATHAVGTDALGQDDGIIKKYGGHAH